MTRDFADRLAEGLNREPHRQGVRQTPRQNPPCRPIDERNQIQKPPTHRNVRDVCRPHQVRLIDRHVAQQVGIDLMLGMRPAGAPLRPDRAQPELADQPPDTPAPHRNPFP